MHTLEPSLQEKSIVFTGFMGVGKTTIGEQVAQKLGRTFIDIDQEIEAEYDMPTADIFKRIGEKAFREREKTLISHYSQQKLKIISVGGGAFLHKEVRDVCLENCIVIFLDISWDTWKERLNMLVDSRPVLQGRSLEDIEALFYKRQEVYAHHHLKIATDHLEIDEMLDTIIDSLKLS
ncbi:shikimate kinase [Caldalkalibacillus salinus]|uniref:shikimate kinase n=1 Tax=Caldalkalibacillus salinus TaxID=2803787 RepID=UPI001923E6CA|nr:shikimate kinase [Caldalkalibacillus salinus]